MQRTIRIQLELSIETIKVLAQTVTNIRGNSKLRKVQRRRFHGWSFAQFQFFVSYKAEARAIAVGYVDPRYTSQKCSKCKHIEHLK